MVAVGDLQSLPAVGHRANSFGMAKGTSTPSAKRYALDLSHERACLQAAGAPAHCLPCGLDEAGRGPLAGPVVAAAVVLPHRFYLPDSDVELPIRLTDSKKLSQRQRDLALAWVQQHCFWAVSGASAREIDAINILQASLLAMRRAALKLQARLAQRGRPDAGLLALVDGNKLPAGLPWPARTVVKGDALCPSIAAASVLAKVLRDRAMQRLAQRYPTYGFDGHKGYPTASHKAAIYADGVSPHHRLSFGDLASQKKALPRGGPR